MAQIGTTWGTTTWISSGGWALNTWADAQESDTGAPVCGTPSVASTVIGAPSINSCGGEAVSAIYVGNDLDVELEGAASPAGSYLNSATVTYTIFNQIGTAVVGPTAMPYVSVTNGNYLGVLESSVVDALITAGTMVVGNRYRVTWLLTSGTKNGRWDRYYPLLYRGTEC